MKEFQFVKIGTYLINLDQVQFACDANVWNGKSDDEYAKVPELQIRVIGDEYPICFRGGDRIQMLRVMGQTDFSMTGVSEEKDWLSLMTNGELDRLIRVIGYSPESSDGLVWFIRFREEQDRRLGN